MQNKHTSARIQCAALLSKGLSFREQSAHTCMHEEILKSRFVDTVSAHSSPWYWALYPKGNHKPLTETPYEDPELTRSKHILQLWDLWEVKASLSPLVSFFKTKQKTKRSWKFWEKKKLRSPIPNWKINKEAFCRTCPSLVVPLFQYSILN